MSAEAAVATLDAAVGSGTTAGWALAAGTGAERELLAAGGWAQLSPDRRAVDVDTRFDLASLTKVVATLPVVLALVGRGALSPDTRVVDVLPEFSADDPERARVTVEHLLTHTSGLGPDPAPAELSLGPEALRRAILAAALRSRPGERVLYSDLGFLVLAWVAERIAGAPLDALLAAEVTGPLGLRRTRFGPLPGPRTDVAATEARPDGLPVRGTVHDETAAALGVPVGHAGLFADAADLGAYLGAWADPSDRWLPWALRAQALRDHTGATRERSGPGAGGHRGLGWTARHDPHDQLGDRWPTSAVFHSGFTGTSLALDPVSGRWVVLLTNDVHLGRGRGTINPLRRAVHDALAPE